jgi:2-methylisocitrate lyase-like PEP mutase family enzyme
MNLSERAKVFHALHRDRILVLPNAWDAGSARIIERAGASAIATTSGGVSWAAGLPDGQRLTRTQMLEAVAQIVQAVSVPVTADMEGGYGESDEDTIETVRGLVRAGAVGVNLEDSGNGGDPLVSLEAQTRRLRVARATAVELGVDVFINARTDVFLYGVGSDPTERLEETVRRANAYLHVGANGVFVPGVADAETIAHLAKRISGPLNTMAVSGSPSIAECKALGVARVSFGSALAQAAYSVAQRIAEEALGDGQLEIFGEYRNGATFRALNSLMG